MTALNGQSLFKTFDYDHRDIWPFLKTFPEDQNSSEISWPQNLNESFALLELF